MHDMAYLREHAERYRHLARVYSDLVIRNRLDALAEELDDTAQELGRLSRLHYALPYRQGGPVPNGASRLDSIQCDWGSGGE